MRIYFSFADTKHAIVNQNGRNNGLFLVCLVSSYEEAKKFFARF